MDDGFPKGQYSITSPPAIYRDLLITGAAVPEAAGPGPRGDIRAFDNRTGKLANRTGVKVWSIMTVDTDRGIVYLPTGSATYDFYGGDRKGRGSTRIASWRWMPRPAKCSGITNWSITILGLRSSRAPALVTGDWPHRGVPWHPGRRHLVGRFVRSGDDHQLPCQEPPWGVLTAIDVNTGRFAWRVPLGSTENITRKTGAANLGGSITTAGGVVFIGATNDSRFRAFDSATGAELWITRLEASGDATPIT